MSPIASTRPWHSLALGTLLAGALDMCFASTFWWLKADVTPIRVGQSVAAGLLGRESAIGGGLPTGLLGWTLHYAMIFLMVGFYFLAARRLPVLTRRWLACGTIYGLGLYVVMSYVVVPLSAAHTAGPREFSLWVNLSIIVHALVGILCAWFSRRALQH